MPSKHNPPTVSSSSGSSSEEGDDVEASHGNEEEEEEEEENTPLKPQQQSSKKFNLNSNPNPSSAASKSKPDRDLGSSGEEDDESSGEYESDSDVPLTQNQNSSSVPLDVKPISSKPMAENLKSKKSSVEASPVVALASVKRKPENNEEKDGRKDQKKKKVSDLVEEDEKKSGDEKKLFQRFWTDEDEIVILKGMVNFKKKGIDPATQVNSFFDTIKGSLHTDVSKTQVQSKIRTIKRKYQNALKKVKPGADPENLKPHEEKVYHLCKKVWPEGFGKDDDGEGKSVETNVGGVDSKKTPIKKVSDAGAAASSSPSVKVTALPSKVPAAAPAVVVNNENHQIISSSEYAYLSGSTVVSNGGSTLIPPPGLGEIVSKKGWDVIGSSKAKEFDDKWKNLIIAETKIYLQRIDLVREQTQAMLDMLESSN